ncbi:MAG: hypothetical protein ACFFDN_26150 [Candidatus Hodarchaeota archaeon]
MKEENIMLLTVLNFTVFVLYFVLITVFMILGLMFFLKVFRNLRTKESEVELFPYIGIALMTIFFGITHIFYVYYDYFYLRIAIESVILYRGSVIFGYFGLICLIFVAEKFLKRTKLFFMLINLILYFYGVIFLDEIAELRTFTFIIIPIDMVFVYVVFLYSLVWKAKDEVRRTMVNAFISLFLFGAFSILSRIGPTIFPLASDLTKIIALSGSIVTFIYWGLIFLNVETFTEFLWREKIKELYIIKPSGVTLFYYSFSEKDSEQIPDLIGAGLITVKEVLAQFMQSKEKIRVLDLHDAKILFEHGVFSVFSLVVDEDLHILRSKLHLLRNKFENLFGDVLSKWTGDTTIFLPTKQIIETIFLE